MDDTPTLTSLTPPLSPEFLTLTYYSSLLSLGSVPLTSILPVPLTANSHLSFTPHSQLSLPYSAPLHAITLPVTCSSVPLGFSLHPHSCYLPAPSITVPLSANSRSSCRSPFTLQYHHTLSLIRPELLSSHSLNILP